MSAHQRNSGARALAAALATALVAFALAACGSSSSSSGDARTLLKQTFGGAHKVNSGQLQFSLRVDPSGSSTLTKPITLGFGGPFQSLGANRLPASDFTVSISSQGHTGSLSIISTGTKGFVSLSGTSYQLPAASFQRLESSFSSISGSGTGSHGGTGVLSRLGIQPLDWLRNPKVVGSETLGGTATTHIRATVNVPAFLRDINTFLGKASSLGAGSNIPSSLSPSEQQKIASNVRNPSFDVWTGNADKTMRKLTIGLDVPVTGQASALLGGLRSAGILLSLSYADLNRPQTITAPTNVQPYSVFSSRLAALLQQVETGVATGGGLGSSTGTGTTGTGGTSTGAAGATSAYSQCITKAAGDISKMQKCASLLSGG